MQFRQLEAEALKVLDSYHEKDQSLGNKLWNIDQHALALVSDVGQLIKLLQAFQGYRASSNLRASLTHEFGDCLWSLIVLAHLCNINLEQAFHQAIKDIVAKDQLPIA